MNIVLEIRSKYNTLSKTNKRIADFILSDTEAFISGTAIQLAELCQTSSASIIRFVYVFGYKGFDEFKIELAKEMGLSETNLNISPGITVHDSLEDLANKTQYLIDQTTKDVFYQLDIHALKQAIERIRKAGCVYVFGVGASSLPAYDLYHKFNRINKRCVFSFDSHMTVEFLNYLEPNDCVIVYSYGGRSIEGLLAAEIALQKGVELIVITRDAKSNLRDMATTLLTVPDNEPAPRVGAIASKLSMLILTDLIYLGVIQKDLPTIEKQLIETSKLTQKMKN